MRKTGGQEDEDAGSGRKKDLGAGRSLSRKGKLIVMVKLGNQELPRRVRKTGR